MGWLISSLINNYLVIAYGKGIEYFLEGVIFTKVCVSSPGQIYTTEKLPEVIFHQNRLTTLCIPNLYTRKDPLFK